MCGVEGFRLTLPEGSRRDQAFADLVDGDWVAIATNEWELLTGVLLDTRTKLEQLRSALMYLKERDLLDYRNLRELYFSGSATAVESVLRFSGYPWAKQKSVLFNQPIDFDLMTATFEQMDSIKGIGEKLASLWMRITHPERANDFVVIDVHVRRFLRTQLGVDEAHKTYEELSTILREEARLRNITITQLDELIVGNGIRARTGQPVLPLPERVET